MITIDLRKTKKPYKKLGECRIAFNSNSSAWQEELKAWLRRRRFVGFKTPCFNDFRSMAEIGHSLNYAPYGSALTWHKDCNGNAAWVLVWSDYRPTQIATQVTCGEATGEVLTCAPYGIYAINNKACWHRAQQVHGDLHPRRFMVIRLYPNKKKGDL